MKKTKPSRLERTAYHEAGHVAACYFLRLSFKSISIEPKGDFLGVVNGCEVPKSFQPDLDTSSKTRDRIEREILCTLAGGAAEARLAGRKNWRGAGGDVDACTNLALYIGGDEEEASAFINWMIVRAKNWVKRELYWCAIATLAKELLEKHTIKAKEARSIIREAIQKYDLANGRSGNLSLNIVGTQLYPLR